MKRKIAVSIMLSLMLVISLAAVASAEVSINGPATVQPGQTITITVSSNAAGSSGVIGTSGLEFEGVSSPLSSQGMVITVGDTVTYTYRVVASAGQTVQFNLTNVKESVNLEDIDVANQSWSATVSGATPTETPTATPSETPSQPTPSPSPSSSPSPSETPSQNPSASPSDTASPSDSGSPSPSGSATQTVTPSGSNLPGNNTSTPTGGTGGGTTGGGTTGGGTTGGGTYLPRTADSTHMWLFAGLAAAVGIIAIVAAKKCAIPARSSNK